MNTLQYLYNLNPNSNNCVLKNNDINISITNFFEEKNIRSFDIILFGSGIPDKKLGNSKNAYINTINGNIYVKALNNNWLYITTILSPRGPQFLINVMILIGCSDPDNINGNNNDVFVNVVSGDFFVKNNTDWIYKNNIHRLIDTYKKSYQI